MLSRLFNRWEKTIVVNRYVSWLLLCVAILCEVAGTISMKLSHGFNNLLPTVLIFIFYPAALIPLNLALRRIDVSLAYAIWSGMGTALITTIGVLWFREPVTALKMISIVLIISGVIGLNLRRLSIAFRDLTRAPKNLAARDDA